VFQRTSAGISVQRKLANVEALQQRERDWLQQLKDQLLVERVVGKEDLY
jgi:hypothetical protein